METKTIGNKITEARKRMNISQAQLSEQLFISAQAVGKWERGESIPDLIMFNRLAKILGVDLNYFSDDFPSMVGEKSYSESAEKKELPVGNEEAKLSWDMSRGNWLDADFSGLKNLKEKFGSSNMKNCKFIGSDLSELLLRSNNMEGCDFSESDFSNSQLQNSNLSLNAFKNCNLNSAEFSGSNITGCDFSGADLTRAVIKNGGIDKCVMTNAVLNHTTFNAAYIGNIVFEGKIEDCYFENCGFSKVTFQNTVLINTFFKGRSLKKVKFIDCKADRMTYEFLKQGKADLSGISLI